MTESKNSVEHADMVGKTVASVTESDVTMRDTYGDEYTVTRTLITFADGSTTTFGDVQMDLYEADDEDDSDHEKKPQEKSTCRHCGRAIVLDPKEGWIDPEAGYDDEDGDGVWRVTCDRHDTFVAEHEPTVEARYRATFNPQAWVNNDAIDVDPEGETSWDCTAAVLANLPYFERLADRNHDGWHDLLDNDDVLKNDPAAPEWVREHRGPFSIHITKSD